MSRFTGRCTRRTGVPGILVGDAHALFGNSMRNSPPSRVHKELGRYGYLLKLAQKTCFQWLHLPGWVSFSAPPTALSAGLGASWGVGRGS